MWRKQRGTAWLLLLTSLLALWAASLMKTTGAIFVLAYGAAMFGFIPALLQLALKCLSPQQQQAWVKHVLSVSKSSLVCYKAPAVVDHQGRTHV